MLNFFTRIKKRQADDFLEKTSKLILCKKRADELQKARVSTIMQHVVIQTKTGVSGDFLKL